MNSDYLEAKKIEITGVPKSVSQVKYIGDLLKKKISDKPGALHNTALVLADEALLNPLLNALPDGLDTANITMGYPLKHTAVATFFAHFFSLYLIDDNMGWHYKSVLSFLARTNKTTVCQKRHLEAPSRGGTL